MKALTRRFVVATVALGSVAASTLSASACDGRGRSFGGYSSFRRAQPSDVQPVYSQPRYPQPTQPCPTQRRAPAPTFATSPSQPQQIAATPNPTPNPAPARSQVQAPARGQLQPPLGSGSVSQTPSPQKSAPASQLSSARLNALQLLGGGNSTSQPPAETDSSQETSLPQFQPAAPRQTAAHVGDWIAKLPNGATIRLSLEDDGNFTWTAASEGKTSRFEGRFTMNDEQLTLVRAQDNQQLAGSITLQGRDKFNFQLGESKDGGLDFQRS